MGPAGGSSSSRRVDPCANLKEAIERNAREAREEREAAEKVAAQAAREQAEAAAKAQMEAATMETEVQNSRSRPPLLAIPLRAVAPDTSLPLAEEIVQDPPLLERREDPVALAGRAPPAAPTGAGQGGQSSAAPEGPAGGEPENRAGLEVQLATGRRAGGSAAPPELHQAAGAGQPAEDLEAANTAVSECTPSGRTGELDAVAQGVRSRLQAQAALLQQLNQEFLSTRATIRVSPLFLAALLS